MNFSNPNPIKARQVKGNPVQEFFKKIWAGTGMISLMTPGSTTKDNIDSKNVGVIIFSILVIYLLVCGAWLNVQWIMNVTISADWFYYVGIAVLVHSVIGIFHVEKDVREFAVEKKIIIANRDSLLERVIGRSKVFNIFSILSEINFFLWVILGIFCFDTLLFIGLFIVGISFSCSVEYLCKKITQARTVLFLQSISLMLAVLYILSNHFLNN